MGEVREGGEMTSPVDLGQALAAIGLFRAAPEQEVQRQLAYLAHFLS